MDKDKPAPAPAPAPASTPLEIVRDALLAAGVNADVRSSAGVHDTVIFCVVKNKG